MMSGITKTGFRPNPTHVTVVAVSDIESDMRLYDLRARKIRKSMKHIQAHAQKLRDYNGLAKGASGGNSKARSTA